jgi:hypothetical protein
VDARNKKLEVNDQNRKRPRSRNEDQTHKKPKKDPYAPLGRKYQYNTQTYIQAWTTSMTILQDPLRCQLLLTTKEDGLDVMHINELPSVDWNLFSKRLEATVRSCSELVVIASFVLNHMLIQHHSLNIHDEFMISSNFVGWIMNYMAENTRGNRKSTEIDLNETKASMKRKKNLLHDHELQQQAMDSIESLGLESLRYQRESCSQVHGYAGIALVTNWKRFLVSAVHDNAVSYTRHRYNISRRAANSIITQVLKHSTEKLKKKLQDDEFDFEDLVEPVKETDVVIDMSQEKVEHEHRVITARNELHALLHGIPLSYVSIVLGKEVKKFNEGKVEKKQLRNILLFPQGRMGIHYIRVCKEVFNVIAKPCMKKFTKEQKDLSFHLFIRACCPLRQLQRLRQLNIGADLDSDPQSPFLPYKQPVSITTNGTVVGFGALLSQKLAPDANTTWERKLAYERLVGKCRMKWMRQHKPQDLSEEFIGCVNFENAFNETRLMMDKSGNPILRGLRWLGTFTPDALKREFEERSTQFACFDPGVDSLMVSMNECGEKSDLTLDIWKKLTGRDLIKQKSDRARKWKISGVSVEKIEADWCEKSLKVPFVQDYIEAVQLRIQNWQVLWKLLQRRMFRSITFRSKRLHQSAMDRASQILVGQQNSTNHDGTNAKYPSKVAFIGDMSRDGSPKAKGPVPSIALREHASKKGMVCLVDEYLTSQKCSGCGNDAESKMKHPKIHVPRFRCNQCNERWKRSDEANAKCSEGHERGLQLVDDYKTFICSRCECSWNRDDNAALNILGIVKMYMRNGRRPQYLSRPG